MMFKRLVKEANEALNDLARHYLSEGATFNYTMSRLGVISRAQ